MDLGDNLLSFQRDNGGFPKSKDFEAKLGRAELLRNFFDRHRRDTTLDNGATHTQIRDLARVYTLTELPRFRHGCERGIECLLVTQYDNGGWPQRFPEPRGYARYITFNDHAMVGALSVLHDVARGEEPFAWADEKLRRRAREAVDRGVECILRCQVVVDGKPTVWGQQHDHVTLEPRPARSFEPVSLCSTESVGVVEFLMSLDPPTPEVVAAIEAAVAWLDGPAKLRASEHRNDVARRRLGDDDEDDHEGEDEDDAKFLWSRLYEIGTNRPVFGDRDGKFYYDVTEISEERQQGYAWYVTGPRGLIERAYPAWRERVGR